VLSINIHVMIYELLNMIPKYIIELNI